MLVSQCGWCNKSFGQPKCKYMRKCCSISCAAKVGANRAVLNRKSSIDIDKAVILYNSGLSVKQVGIALKMSEGAVYRQFVKHKIQRRSSNSGITRTKNADEIVDLYETVKLSTVDISNYFGDLYPETVRRVLIRSGVKVRSPREGVVLKNGSIFTEELIPLLLKRRYEEGLSYGVIAKRFGVTGCVIKGFFARQRKQVSCWLQSGISPDEISGYLQTTSEIVAKIIERIDLLTSSPP